MKKFLALLMAAALTAAAFTGCAGAGQAGTTPATATDTSAPPEPAAEEPSPEPAAEEPSAETEPAAEPAAGDTAAESAEPAAAADTGEIQELNLAIFEGGYGPDFWNEIVRLFEADNPGYKINMQIAAGPTGIGDIIRPQIVAGNSPDFLNLADNDQTGIVSALIKDRGLLEITDVFDGPQYDSEETLRSKILPGFLESNKCAPYGDGKIYLAPGGASPMGPVYNIALFEEKGWEVPVTWDDFFALGELSKAEGIPLFTYQGIYPSYFESILLPALASALGPDYEKIENFTPGIWSDPRSIAVLENIARIYTDGHLMEGTVALNHTDSQTAQMQNKAVFIPNGTWMENEMADVERAPGYRFGLIPPPVMKEGDTRYVASGVEQFSIPAAAKNPESAKLFLRYLYTDTNIENYAKLNGGAVLATTNALELVRPYITEGTYGMFNAYNEPGASALIFGFAAPPDGTKIVYADEIYNPISDVMTGQMSAAEWAASMDQAYQDMADGL